MAHPLRPDGRPLKGAAPADRPSRIRGACLLLVGALAFSGFIALGAWQLRRLVWKEDLIARVDRQVHAPPIAAPGVAQWPALARSADEYRRVEVHGRLDVAKDTLVRASTELGAGYWVLTPMWTDQGFWVLVNRGFIPPEQRARIDRNVSEGDTRQDIVGLLRLSEPGGSLLQRNDPAANRWTSRDVAAIAAAHGLGSVAATGPVAPYFIDAQADDAQANAWPRPGLTVLRFSNNHLVYAFTWFTLAAMVAGVFGFGVFDERRLRRSRKDAAC